jgi:hypothetical protein
MTVAVASMMMIKTIHRTTAEVAAVPTAAALRWHRIPRQQPTIATTAPNNTDLTRPTAQSFIPTAPLVWLY